MSLVRLAFTSALLLLLRSAEAQAEATVDPRYPYTLELVGALGFSSAGSSEVGIARASFFAPVAQNVQGGGGLWVDGLSSTRLVGGLRYANESAPWRTTLDVQLVGDLAPAFALGLRGALGVHYEVVAGLRLGAAIGGAMLAIRFQAIADAGLALSYSW
jgi:predicted anti-sigma-YlaC factor YlaD